MSIFSFLKSAPKVIDNVFDMEKGLLTQVGGWVGNQHFTDQERAIHDKAMGDAVRGFAVATLGENTDRSKTRRTMAIEWFRMQIWLIMLTVLCVFLDKLGVLWDMPLGLYEPIKAITFSGALWGVTSGIGLFFWGSHAMRSSKLSNGK